MEYKELELRIEAKCVMEVANNLAGAAKFPFSSLCKTILSLEDNHSTVYYEDKAGNPGDIIVEEKGKKFYYIRYNPERVSEEAIKEFRKRYSLNQ